MKKLLIAAVLGTLALTACSTNTANTEATPTAKPDAHTHDKGHPHHGTRPDFYVCEGNTKLVAHPDSNNDIMRVEVTAPSLSLKNQMIELKLAPSASGERYINDKNPASIYEWHTKGHEGVFSVNVNGTSYDYSCEIARPPKK